jgi:hypothetical protein
VACAGGHLARRSSLGGDDGVDLIGDRPPTSPTCTMASGAGSRRPHTAGGDASDAWAAPAPGP